MRLKQSESKCVMASMEAGVQITNEWGEPKGEPKPFKEIVKSELNTVLNSKSHSRSAKIEEVFKAECKSEVDKFMKSFKEGLMLQTTEYLRKQIEKVVK